LGNQTEITYFNKSGNFAPASNGSVGVKYSYDNRGNEIESFAFGADKKLVRTGVITRKVYDELDNCIEIAHYDRNNKLVMSADGYAKVTYMYNGKNQQVERRYYNANGNLFVNESEGFAILKWEYDNKGNETKASYFDASENLRKNNPAVIIREFDEMGRVIRAARFNENEKPYDYLPEFLYGYDKWGNRNYFAVADGFDNKITGSEGYSILRNEFDIRGNELSESYYDADDKPCINNVDNVHKIEHSYDKQNRETEIRYYDINSKPDTIDGIHKIETVYDGKGNIIEKRYYDASVSLQKSGVAIEKRKYDERNRLIEYAMYDYLDRPVNYNGYHRYVRSYDASGFWYDKNYTVNGNVTSEWKRDPNTEKWTRTDIWRQDWENTQKRLPVNLNDYTRVTAISLNGNICTVTLRINFSKYDLSGSDMQILEDDGKSYAEYWWKDYEMPRNATLVVVGVDNAGRELYRVSY
jgi:hypothetical protein